LLAGHIRLLAGHSGGLAGHSGGLAGHTRLLAGAHAAVSPNWKSLLLESNEAEPSLF
jgi:hypothetical protein